MLVIIRSKKPAPLQKIRGNVIGKSIILCTRKPANPKTMRSKPNRFVTIKDIAKELNISVSTVSRALRDAYDVSPETKEKVLRVARELNYKPNLNAIGLVNNHTHNIGVILPYVTNYYFSTLITGIQKIAWSNNYNVLLYVTNDSAERELAILQNLSYSSLDGLIVCLSSPANSSDYFRQIINSGTPIVFIDRIADDVPASRVVQDDYNGAFAAVEHLIASGYSNIAHISGPKGFPVTDKRELGYRDALAKHGLEVEEDWIIHGGFSQQDGERATDHIMSLSKTPDAIFAVNDSLALGAMVALKRRQIRIGDDVGIIGFTNDPAGTLVSPSLSTMAEAEPFDAGTQSCELLMRHIRKRGFPPRELVLPCELIVRESTLRSQRILTATR